MITYPGEEQGAALRLARVGSDNAVGYLTVDRDGVFPAELRDLLRTAPRKPVSPSWTVGVLVEASRSAAMICVGWKGVTHSRRERSGSTAAGVARTAHSAVAVIRRRHANPFPTNLWIVGVGPVTRLGRRAANRFGRGAASGGPPANAHNVGDLGRRTPPPMPITRTCTQSLPRGWRMRDRRTVVLRSATFPCPTSLLDFLAPSTNIFQLVVCRKR